MLQGKYQKNLSIWYLYTIHRKHEKLRKPDLLRFPVLAPPDQRGLAAFGDLLG